MAKHIEQRLIEQLKAKGKSEGEARAIARAKMKQAGNVKSDGSLTAKGEARSKLGAAGRAKDRAAKASGKKASEYTYNQLNNTARLKKDRAARKSER